MVVVVVVQLRNESLDAPVAAGCCRQGSGSVSDGESLRCLQQHKKFYRRPRVFQSIPQYSRADRVRLASSHPRSESLGTL